MVRETQKDNKEGGGWGTKRVTEERTESGTKENGRKLPSAS